MKRIGETSNMKVGSFLREFLSLKKSKEMAPCFNYERMFLNICALDLCSGGMLLHLGPLTQ